MASVFLSYGRHDQARARAIALELEKAGHSVWWDRNIKGGAQFSMEIEGALAAAEVVVVLWSRHSVDSAWVRDEAAVGRDGGRLVPIRLDSTVAPLGFRQYQTIDLPGGRISSCAREGLLSAVQAVVGKDLAGPINRKPPRRGSRFTFLAWAASGLVLVAIASGIVLWRPSAGPHEELVLAVGSAGGGLASQARARDVAIKLGSLQSATSNAIRLIESADRGQKPDFVFEVGTAAAEPTKATLALKLGTDRSILWSREFEQPSGKRADLLQQLAFTAGRVIGCAFEGRSARPALKSATFKTYLNACALLAEASNAEPRQAIAMLSAVTEQSPEFTPAWSKLLLAEMASVSLVFNAGNLPEQEIANHRRRIAAAKTIDPRLPAAALAEAMLLPQREFLHRMGMIEQAAAISPDDPQVAQFLAGALMATGRQREGVEAAARGFRLDPLSPDTHGNYITLLMYSGAFDAAERELAKAEELWPGTANLRDVQYRYHLRYGDVQIARNLLAERTEVRSDAFRLYLDARADPSPAKVRAMVEYIRGRLKNLENPSAGIGFATLAYAHFNLKEEVFSTLLTWPKADDIAVLTEGFFRPEFREVRRDPRFLRIAQRAGLLAYWRDSGEWPDFCFEPELPYDCKAEAAKLR